MMRLLTMFVSDTCFRIWTWDQNREEFCLPEADGSKSRSQPDSHSGIDSRIAGKIHRKQDKLDCMTKHDYVLLISFDGSSMKDSGAYLEHRLSGVHTVVIQGLNAGTLDLSQNLWRHQVHEEPYNLIVSGVKTVN